ncbi:serine hydrolase domain-containing protein [Spirosoma koreense]
MPGCQLAISRNGQLLISKAWGMADLERQVPLSTTSIIEVGSVSKQFTAAAILLLAQQGRIALTDNVRKYIPELPDYGDPITLGQMMHHTSGLRDWGAIALLTGWPRGRTFYSNNDALEIIARQKQLNHKPNQEFLYSNSNYNLFAILVERVSGLSLAAFTKKYIFEPAGMTHTQWRDDPNRLIANRAIAYITSDNFKADSTFKIDMPNEYAYGNGGLLTTAEDLIKWNNFYLQGRLGTSSLLAQQLQTKPLANGAMNPYAAGLFISTVLGWSNVSHSGTTASYCAYLEAFPQLNLSVAVISNTSLFSVYDFKSAMDSLFVVNKTKPAAAVKAGASSTLAADKGIAGLYVLERDGSTFQLAINENQVVMDNHSPLITVTKNVFKSANVQLNINGLNGLYITLSSADTIRFRKVQPVSPAQKEQVVYTGSYFSRETNSTLRIEVEATKLVVRLKADRVYPLVGTYQDGFTVPKLGNVVFLRGVHHQITGLQFNTDRARKVSFEKVAIPAPHERLPTSHHGASQQR